MRRPRESFDCPAGPDGIELLQASLDQHVYDRHIHDSYAVGVTFRGVQRFWCRGATHDSTPGDTIVIRPGEAHDGQSGSAGGYGYRMFYVRPDVFDSALNDAFGGRASVAMPTPVLADSSLSNRLSACWSAVASAPSSLAAEESFIRGLAVLAKRHLTRTPFAEPRVHQRGVELVSQYLREHLGRSVMMSELVRLVSLSRFQLTRQFEKQYGLPLHAYHLHLRLEEAKRRLATGQPICEVATDLGFIDQSHLHRRFKGCFGMTPGQWRAAHRYKTSIRERRYADAHALDTRHGRETV
jgi:AraC-like DNA-binding protein